MSGSYPCSVYSARDPSAPIRGEIGNVEKERVWYYRSKGFSVPLKIVCAAAL